MITLPQEFSVIRSLMPPDEQLFLVGGAVRDAILSKPNQDLDFVCAGDPRIIGRKLAEKLSGAFFMLDDERNACRVIAKNDQGARIVFDFTQMRGLALKEDLLERDFTINAMAVDLDHPLDVIDPLNGSLDLKEKWLRPCKTNSFNDDPLRVIRAVRYAVKYGLNLESKTIDLLKEAVKGLNIVSKERKRDELFKILELDQPWIALELLEQYGILSHLGLNGFPDKKQAYLRLKMLAAIIDTLNNAKKGVETKDTKLSFLGSLFSESRLFLLDRLNQVNQSERSIHALDALIALIWDLDEVEGSKAADGLALSREEQDQISVCLRHKCCIIDQFSSQQIPDRKFIYRYYQSMGVAGVDMALLTLVESASESSMEWNPDRWSTLAMFCQKLVEAWIFNPDYINPKLLLTGRDLMFEFDIPQGPRIGLILDGLREEQAIGTIQNHTQALAWVDAQLQKGFISG